MFDPVRSDRGISLMWSALDGLAAQQQAIANNVANVDTPGYRRQSVPFEQVLRAQLGSHGVEMTATAPGHLSGRVTGAPLGAAQAAEVLASGKNDGNNVEIEREMTELAQTQIKYYAVSQAMSAKLATLREIVTRSV